MYTDYLSSKVIYEYSQDCAKYYQGSIEDYILEFKIENYFKEGILSEKTFMYSESDMKAILEITGTKVVDDDWDSLTFKEIRHAFKSYAMPLIEKHNLLYKSNNKEDNLMKPIENKGNNFDMGELAGFEKEYLYGAQLSIESKDNIEKHLKGFAFNVESNEFNKLSEHKGSRFNKGKLRYDLLDPIAVKEVVKVLTKGAEKYGDRNWEKGLGWMGVLASFKRHVASWELGEDYDSESGELHLSHAVSNLMYLITYHHTYKEGDDRVYKNDLKETSKILKE